MSTSRRFTKFKNIHAYALKIPKSHAYALKIHHKSCKRHAYEQEIHKSHMFESMEDRNKIHAYEQESYQSLAYEHRLHVYKLKDRIFVKPMFQTPSSNIC